MQGIYLFNDIAVFSDFIIAWLRFPFYTYSKYLAMFSQL